MKSKTNSTLMAALIFCGAISSASAEKLAKVEGTDGTSSLTIGATDDAYLALAAISGESVMERFQMNGRDGHNVTYVAFTDTDLGGLVFLDKKLFGTISKRDAQAFYSCRGYTSTIQAHWMEQAAHWVDGLMSAATPATSVTLHFSGKSTQLSIKEVTGNQLLAGMSIFDLSTNPISMLKKLNSANDNMKVRDRYEKMLQNLRGVVPGMTEDQLADTLKPEDIYFGDGGIVMSYPRFAYEYFLSDGVVQISQQPSFHRLGHASPALFYVANAKWERCTPTDWRSAMPEAKPVAAKASK